jgi:hypothetical protein
MDTFTVFLTLKRAALLGLALAVTGAALLPTVAVAQPVPSYGQPPPSYGQPPPNYGQPPPTYAQPYQQETIRGTVYSINGKYNITVRDSRGFLDNVKLHDGTIINPRGWTLRPGNRVTVNGQPSGRVFVADEIDTPYTPYPAYYPYQQPYYRLGVRVGW